MLTCADFPMAGQEMVEDFPCGLFERKTKIFTHYLEVKDVLRNPSFADPQSLKEVDELPDFLLVVR